MKIDYVFLINKISDACEILKFAMEKDPLLLVNNKEAVLKLTDLNFWLINELSKPIYNNEHYKEIMSKCINLNLILNELGRE
ncbi:hypothetical protein PVK64_20050 [Aliivibrio sp. S4TY2]|uniref:hypothetical protein n=1 Tax=unclassified Aliivibrio TaxID=2645654 RepID=UPI0023785A22|nr:MULTISPECIES: hypothetical protein [unclassified Aliivibrio]MDD9158459.1 hypothetical protein [Aliivibrio sp. S4TY2]MDD9162459.1 hypothetical protein [Aliivibrio sp. S4TY1]MDD9165986.1 hypothetical protein [Aliivibrio sp. S4MY2]MDD9169944.1 hypothetical protein [Aliivibrio sp. S4MY4]MDD9187035.1 hypothetical protein [Aliivibrio sp. S4MY3]